MMKKKMKKMDHEIRPVMMRGRPKTNLFPLLLVYRVSLGKGYIHKYLSSKYVEASLHPIIELGNKIQKATNQTITRLDQSKLNQNH